ncbi:transcriptional regulator with GAF, ATPase, and Fis domain [Nocardioides zeae]|uniref:Transcriptional regulator with GAF, ATPase, and Fis domain n=1 Tax=Nocardioides zeae TaxID=1457234 RepID=A0ACC6ICE1_9ACTN|nr:GAF and ANTAR domain-containing protein [Nocardioides zeae]MDR6175397.1 transcriptional regulator with GAF, ATPase, and Fis domain [Nocardioides zeae]MDR6208330.1 transcriptional regulator with GAF, ATPase, and Fis domain [Nocardioides zeae]
MGAALPFDRALIDAIRHVNAPADVPTALETIVVVARETLPLVDAVSVTVGHRDGRLETKAATAELAWDLDRAQYELGEGPCMHAVDAEHTVVAQRLRHEQRWPAYVPVAVRRGVRAQVGLRLYVDDTTLGGLDLYSTSAEQIDDDVVRLAELFAAAAEALGGIRRREQLTTALRTRELIGVATGIVMVRYGLDRGRAFNYLSRVSQLSNTKLARVAEELIERTEDGVAPRLDG